MRLAVLGASGRTGRPLVRRALDAGHAVSALVRAPKAFGIEHDRLTVVQGDATDPAAVGRVVEGADAVLLALGHTKTSSPDIMARSAEAVLKAMREYGVTRVVTLTGAGVADPADPSSLGASFMRGVMRVVAGTMLADSERHVEAFRASETDWTAVRAPRLTTGEASGDTKLGIFKMGPGAAVSREDVAAAMLRLAETGEYSRAAPMIAPASV